MGILKVEEKYGMQCFVKSMLDGASDGNGFRNPNNPTWDSDGRMK
jgi:hypothetical protein